MAGSRHDCKIYPPLLRTVGRECKIVNEEDARLRQDFSPREVYDRDGTSYKIKFTIPPFAGYYDPDAYLTWELVVQ